MTQDRPESLAAAPRCLAKTRKGTLCQSPAVKGKRRCRMHGGTNSGAPKGNRNAWKHGSEFIHARSLIMAQTGLPSGMIPREMVEAKMAVLQAKRMIKKKKNQS